MPAEKLREFEFNNIKLAGTEDRIMASKNRPAPKKIEHVAIPGEFLDVIDDYFDSLGHQVLKDAVTRAFARKRGFSPGTVTTDDLVQAFHSHVLAATEEFEIALKTGGTSHVARKAS